MKAIRRSEFWRGRKPICRYCRVKLSRASRTIDHVWPKAMWPDRAKRHADSPENLAPCCKPCQAIKGGAVLPGLRLDAHGGLVIDWPVVRFAMATLRIRNQRHGSVVIKFEIDGTLTSVVYRSDVEDLVKPRREGR